MSNDVKDFFVQKKRLEDFAIEFENRFQYASEANFVKESIAFFVQTNGGIKNEGEAFPAFASTPEEAVSQYISHINSLNVDGKNSLMWRDRPILDCFDDDELGRVCTVYSRFALGRLIDVFV